MRLVYLISEKVSHIKTYHTNCRGNFHDVNLRLAPQKPFGVIVWCKIDDNKLLRPGRNIV